MPPIPTNQPHATTNTQHIIEARVAGIDQTNTRTSCCLPGSPAHHGQHIALHCAVATCCACTRRGSAISSADCLRSRTSCCCARSRSAGPTHWSTRSGAGGRRAQICRQHGQQQAARASTASLYRPGEAASWPTHGHERRNGEGSGGRGGAQASFIEIELMMLGCLGLPRRVRKLGAQQLRQLTGGGPFCA